MFLIGTIIHAASPFLLQPPGWYGTRCSRRVVCSDMMEQNDWHGAEGRFALIGDGPFSETVNN